MPSAASDSSGCHPSWATAPQTRYIRVSYHGDRSVVRLDHMGDDRQAEPGATGFGKSDVSPRANRSKTSDCSAPEWPIVDHLQHDVRRPGASGASSHDVAPSVCTRALGQQGWSPPGATVPHHPEPPPVRGQVEPTAIWSGIT